MLAEERLSRIMKLLSQQRTATVQELCEALDASESTIRRDLNELDRMGKVNKVHGGATLPDSQFLADEPTMAAKEALAVVQKKCIAKAAAALITAEDFVFLDAGSTTLALVRELSGPALDARYVTNGVAHARLLAQKGCKVFLVGGLLRPETEKGFSLRINNLCQTNLCIVGLDIITSGKRIERILHTVKPRVEISVSQFRLLIIRVGNITGFCVTFKTSHLIK